ncbi:hypothetical protein [Vreelandella neptunia]|uniref:Uncharacterized protein n=1 Tax=Vreelandella neptunia TaxID=115551 RepID=A0ABS9S9R0_9GAMM|nr:hypothetical protein [Halomonas neptunia]MCH4812843.1 hypothetical protein [Halomonas neptunia]
MIKQGRYEKGKEKEKNSFKIKPLSQNINTILKKNVLALSLLATAFAPAVQAYEQTKSSGARMVKPLSVKPLSMNSSLSSGYTPSPDRRTSVNKVGSLGFSQQRVTIDKMDRNLASIIERTGIVDLDALMESGIASYNDDKSILSINIASDHASSNSFIETTRMQPLVISAYDPANEMGNIILIESKRHSDGSASMTMRFIGPSYFDNKSTGGGLTDKQHETMTEVYGGNPTEAFRAEGEYSHSFTSITSMGLQTVAGLVMQGSGATLGLHTDYYPDVRTWETTSGGPFVKKITVHVEVKLDPHWKMLVPGAELEGGYYPMYTYSQGGNEILVNGGVMAMPVADYASSFPLDKFVIYYDKESQTALTGLSLIIITFAITWATAGAGAYFGVSLAGLSPLATASVAAGISAGFTIASGNLTQGVTTSPLNLTAVTDKDSTKRYGEFGDKWHNTARNINNEGALSDGYQSSSQFNKEKVDQWDHLVDPMYDLQPEDYILNETNLRKQVRPDPEKMFDNKYDNPNHGNNSCRRFALALVGGSMCRYLYDRGNEGGEA